MLRRLGDCGQGIAFADLADACADSLQTGLWDGASLSWYVTSIKLDLEARGLVYCTSQRGRQQVHLGPGAG